ncbi:SGNH/GDSL hydrolase family protein [Candidatus Saccharibacteria bacterium]|nr:SGNH/GDSL hydrolase family protein [Candidatus Saccharibacteria bacterium]
MHKRILIWVVIAVAVAAGTLWVIGNVGAQESLPWINSTLAFQKQSDTQSVPTTLNGNIDCYNESASDCSVSTVYGAATQNGTVKLNETPVYNPVYSYTDKRQHFLPIPNSSTAITYTTEPAYGFYLYFNYNFQTIIKEIANPSSSYQITRTPDGILADKSDNRLAADYGSISFSQNGDWMIVSDPNVAMLRVNLQTFEVLPFAPGFNYTIGIDPALKTAVTNDGRYAVVASKEFNYFKIYDLSTCGPTPNSISGPVNCQSRDLLNFISNQFPSFSFVDQARFLDDSSLSIYGNYRSGASSITSRFVVSTVDINPGLNFLALGDSYISGEGAFDYQPGTDVPENKCHLSFVSYPYLIGRDLSYDSYHSVACSGATTDDITNTRTDYKGQVDHKLILRRDRSYQSIDSILSSFKPGYIDQLDFVTKYQPKAITISIIGNDTGMISKLKACFMPGTCFSSYEDRLEFVHEVKSKFSALMNTYSKIKAAGPAGMRIYVIGYPRIAMPGGNCALNVHLDNSEIMFSQQAIDYLDTMIEVVSAKSGAFYVDTNQALEGHRLCEAGPGSVAVNGITAGNDIPTRLNGPIGSESFHPNQMGHQLIENTTLDITNNLTAPMPSPNPNVNLPSENNLEILNAPHTGRLVSNIEFDDNISSDLAYQQTPFFVSIAGLSHSLGASTILQAELHSTALTLGTYSTDIDGNLKTSISIPESVQPGYHSLHFYGTDISGQNIDIYKVLYVAHTADDMDGNGILDSSQGCVGIESANQDYDGDSVDDGCDGNINGLSSVQLPANVMGTVSSQTNNLILLSDDALNPPPTFTEIKFIGPSGGSVLGATTTASKTQEQPAPSNSLRIPGYYFSGSGLAIFVLAAIAYSVRSFLV